MACRGLARSLVKRGHRLQFMVPRLFGDEPVDPGLELMDVSTGFDSLTLEERASLPALGSALAGAGPQAGVYDSSSVRPAPSVGAAGDSLLTGEHLEAARLQGGYGPGVYQEIRWYADYIALLARRLRFDIIHCHDWITYPAGLGARVATGKPLVAHVHATEWDRSGENVNQFVYDLERECFHRSDAVITVSNYTRDVLVERYGVPPEKIVPIHNGVEFEMSEKFVGRESAPADQQRDRIVLFLGRITFQKGPDYFVRAARIVVDRMPNVRFVMAGGGDMYHRMIEMAADLGLGKYFHYTGFLDKDQVARLFARSDLYIMPSVSEPFGLSPLEAMLHGVPVIVSKQSGVSEVIQHCIKVDFWNVEEIAGAIVSVLENPQLSRQLESAGSDEVRRVTWAAAAEKIETVYDSLRGGRT